MLRLPALVVAALLLAAPARAEEAIEALDALHEDCCLYVSVPAVTPELGAALVRAERRGVHTDVMVLNAAAGSPEVSALREAGVRVWLTPSVREAFIVFDATTVAEGPDAMSMVVKRDSKAADRLALEFIGKAMTAMDKRKRL